MSAKWPAFSSTKGAKIDNDKNHGHPDPNQGGGPSLRNRTMIPPASRGGTGHQGRDRMAAPTPSLSGRGGAGNPADRGGMPSVGRQSFPSESRNPNGGGAPALRPTSVSRQFGKPGQQGLPSYPHSQPGPAGAGNVGGRTHKRIAGHFQNKTKGSKATSGSYGDRSPITTNT